MFPKAAVSERAEGSLPKWGPAGMAAAAAGTGTWTAQEKQFPPALLSFFIYNPRFGPREGEVSCGGCAPASAADRGSSRERRPVSVLRSCRVRPGRGPS